MQQWQGPLPPPAALQQFDHIVPNGAERIFAMVEQEQAHRLKYEADRLSAATSDYRRGSWMGFVLGILCVAGAIYTAYIGAHPTVSIALVSLPIMAAVRGFLNRK
jgi:uncharacterized membrane protein